MGISRQKLCFCLQFPFNPCRHKLENKDLLNKTTSPVTVLDDISVVISYGDIFDVKNEHAEEDKFNLRV